ncbi:MAG: hypothetical protein H6850_00440 [Alphaproteobacteria bacterium]|nr:MAG: hypothetical protein H6850_00440 [Alphaproteobacteria bacterium]
MSNRCIEKLLLGTCVAWILPALSLLLSKNIKRDSTDSLPTASLYALEDLTPFRSFVDVLNEVKIEAKEDFILAAQDIYSAAQADWAFAQDARIKTLTIEFIVRADSVTGSSHDIYYVRRILEKLQNKFETVHFIIKFHKESQLPESVDRFLRENLNLEGVSFTFGDIEAGAILEDELDLTLYPDIESFEICSVEKKDKKQPKLNSQATLKIGGKCKWLKFTSIDENKRSVKHINLDLSELKSAGLILEADDSLEVFVDSVIVPKSLRELNIKHIKFIDLSAFKNLQLNKLVILNSDETIQKLSIPVSLEELNVSLNIPLDNQSAPELDLKTGKNLKKLVIEGMGYLTLNGSLQQLEVLEIGSYSPFLYQYKDVLINELLKFFKHVPRLRELSLTGYFSMSDAFFKKFIFALREMRYLEKLDIFLQGEFGEHAKEILRNTRGLKVLGIKTNYVGHEKIVGELKEEFSGVTVYGYM